MKRNWYWRVFATVLAVTAICLAGDNPAPNAPHTQGAGSAQIKGKVRDQANKPVAGVGITIEVISGSVPVTARVATNAKGEYSKIMLRINGQYRVTPSLGGYQFTPGSAAVSGAGGAADFTGTRTK